jgi:hypothetical protein
MEDYFTEMRLSRAFAREFDQFIKSQHMVIPLPEELLEAYRKLKEHYEYEMEKNLS